MRQWIATGVLASQLLAAVCGLQAGVFQPKACCRTANMPCSPQPSKCCRLEAVHLPSLAARPPYTMSPVKWVASPLDRAAASDLSIRTRALSTLAAPATAASPPPIYLRNSVLLL
jgi:hypothetical protein